MKELHKFGKKTGKRLQDMAAANQQHKAFYR